MNLSASLLTFGFFALVLCVQYRLGARWAGLFAALPIITIATCIAAYLSIGVSAVQSVLLGALISIGGSAIAVQVYARCARAHPALAWLAAAASFGLITYGVFCVRPWPILCAALALAMVGASLALAPPRAAETAIAPTKSMFAKWYPRVAGGLCIEGCNQMLAVLPGALVGVFAGAPVLGLSTFVVNHLQDRTGASLRHQAHGYCEGMLMKWAVIVGTYFALTQSAHPLFALAIGFASALMVWGAKCLLAQVRALRAPPAGAQNCAAGIAAPSH